MPGENDLCPGYIPSRLGLSGICCCGLWWEGHQPPHDRRGRIIPPYVLERELKRRIKARETERRRAREREELARARDQRATELAWGRRAS